MRSNAFILVYRRVGGVVSRGAVVGACGGVDAKVGEGLIKEVKQKSIHSIIVWH